MLLNQYAVLLLCVFPQIFMPPGAHGHYPQYKQVNRILLKWELLHLDFKSLIDLSINRLKFLIVINRLIAIINRLKGMLID